MSNSRRPKLVLYGIKNCDSCRKAQGWLKSRNADYTFHDVRESGLPETNLERWLESDQGSKLLNRRSTTWRNLSDTDKRSAESDPLPLMLANPTLIKRPVVTDGTALLDVGFSPDQLEKFI